jgi:nucleoside-diphosphate-sugar epimerase
MSVLLTGATGFLGAHLAIDLLESGYTVKATRRAGSSLQEFELISKFRGVNEQLLTNLHWVECDILDTLALAEAMQGVEQVYHTAAIVSFWSRRFDTMMHTNVEGTANVVNCALEAGVNKLCYASSIAALGREKSGDIIDENTPWRDGKFNTQYAISKFRAEMEVWRGVEEGLPATIVNPGIILGEGKWDKGSCRLVDAAYKGLSFYTKGTNGYVDVRDVSRAMQQLMESDIVNERYVMVAENLEFKDLFTRMAAKFNQPAPKIAVGSTLSQIARLVYWVKSLISGKEPLVTKETARNSLQSFNYISDKIKKDLSFEFTPINQTIERACEARKVGE